VKTGAGCSTASASGGQRSRSVDARRRLPPWNLRNGSSAEDSRFLYPEGETVFIKADFFGWKAILQTESGEPIAEVRRRGLLGRHYEVELRRRGKAYPEFPWLVLLLWYVLLLLKRRMHSHAS